jgi:periplasmic mercuric ion binding protein
VWGNCGMCKNKIEKSLKKEGISKASWNDETKLLVVTYDDTKITNDDIQKTVAAVGYDTEKYTADDKAYNKLPGCCKYDRKEKGN